MTRTPFTLFIDAGVENLRIQAWPAGETDPRAVPCRDITVKNDRSMEQILSSGEISSLLEETHDAPVRITGTMAETVRDTLKRGDVILPAASLWSAARLLAKEEQEPLAIVEISASGYRVLCIRPDGSLLDNLLLVNPACGAGSGINLMRILQKLAIPPEGVDPMLGFYLSEVGTAERRGVPVRTDRCGVFSSSATISDKNQGLPLDYALAVTIKSEIAKPCGRIPSGIGAVYLTGGVFRWAYARECAIDILSEKGVTRFIHDENLSLPLTGMRNLVHELGGDIRSQPGKKLTGVHDLDSLTPFQELKKRYEGTGLYRRIADSPAKDQGTSSSAMTPMYLALDMGSTMAKAVVMRDDTGEILLAGSWDNHGDTVRTVHHVFEQLGRRFGHYLMLRGIGITGSGRYQVRKVLSAVYPHMAGNIHVLVENYAHARGSIDYALERINELKAEGVSSVNENFCLLVDIGGEDTKISVISLKKRELFDNAMNLKCSAGTGSLMDTLRSLFAIDDVALAYDMAFNAEKAYGINATCAVFLMENARRMQAEGHPRDHILASCVHAIVENMARTLWGQVEIPRGSVALLHGQTMLSDPLPLAVTHRLQSFTDSAVHCVVPPLPGHRACIGLVRSLEEMNLPLPVKPCDPEVFLNFKYDKRLFVCRGAVCGDRNARCARTALSWTGEGGKEAISLGGCTAINDRESRNDEKSGKSAPDSYRGVWNFIDSRMPRSDEPGRLVIPRCFIMSEKAYFLASILFHLGFPVHVDNVQEEDVRAGQPHFPIDSCAPNIGATGHFLRLAGSESGIILVPQIDFLPSEGSLGRTCTTNQGGPLIALHIARQHFPESRFHVFELNLGDGDEIHLCEQLMTRMEPVFSHYNIIPDRGACLSAVRKAMESQEMMREELSVCMAEHLEQALEAGRTVTIVMGREYILTPGIYDSHVGKLLRDRGVTALPGYAFDTIMDQNYRYFYWRNPHDIVSKIQAVARGQLHVTVRHPRLREALRRIETGSTGSRLSVVTVSTFRCGPDSVTLPLINEITREYPSLLIQSDAMIAELAHLENRINTHMNQLEKELHNDLKQPGENGIDIKVMDGFFLDEMKPATDVLYFPTLDDNRILTTIFRAMGMTVIDNFSDRTYDLITKTRQGRSHLGDAVCVPMAAVHSDMINAIADFRRRKEEGDPLVEGKNRVILFMHGGDGPCRLGQYVHMFKLSFHRLFGQPKDSLRIMENISSSLLGVDDISANLDRWVGVQAYQAVVMQGVFHSVFCRAASLCRSREEYIEMEEDYRRLKERVFHIMEFGVKPGPAALAVMSWMDSHLPRLSGVTQYFCLGLYNSNGYRKILRRFSRRWIRGRDNSGKERVRIHVDGELYMRVAQICEIARTIIDSLGYDRFDLTYSPIWVFFENILHARTITANRDIERFNGQINHAVTEEERSSLRQMISERHKIIGETRKTIWNLRKILAGPLYKAAGLSLPHPMTDIFSAAEPVIPTLKPFGELVPYTGETIIRLREGTDLVLNVAPEGCMVSSMGQLLTPKILEEGNNPRGIVQNLFSLDGEINADILHLALLKILGPAGYYRT